MDRQSSSREELRIEDEHEDDDEAEQMPSDIYEESSNVTGRSSQPPAGVACL